MPTPAPFGGGPPPPPRNPGPSRSSSSKTSQQYQADLSASMRAILANWHMDLTPALNKLIKQAAANNWNADLFMQAVEKTKQFHQQYVGIFDAKGQLKMQPQQYVAQMGRYKDYAVKVGLDMTKKDYQDLFKNNVSVGEFSLRVSADAVLQQNQTLFDNFNTELKAQGLKPMTQPEQTKYIMGLGNSKYYDIWETANAATQASYSGMDLNRQEIKNIIGYERGSNPDTGRVNIGQQQQQFADLAKQYRQVLPASAQQGFKLSKDDLNQLEFGGPKQAQVAQTVAQLMANSQAFSQQKLGPDTNVLGGRGRNQRAQV